MKAVTGFLCVHTIKKYINVPTMWVKKMSSSQNILLPPLILVFVKQSTSIHIQKMVIAAGIISTPRNGMSFSPEQGPFYSSADHIVPSIITFKDVFCMLLSNVGAQFTT